MRDGKALATVLEPARVEGDFTGDDDAAR